MNKRFFNLKTAAWLLLASTIAAALAWQLSGPSARFATNILALLPAAEREPFIEDISQKLASAASGNAVLLINAGTNRASTEAASQLMQQLQASGLFSQIQGQVNAQQVAQLSAWHTPRRANILSPEQQRALQQPPAALAQQLLANMFDPAYSQPLPFNADPLNLHGNFLNHSAQTNGNTTSYAGWLTVQQNQQHWVMLLLKFSGNAFAPATATQLQQTITTAIANTQQQYPTLKIQRSGLLFHATHASQTAQQEISTVGLGSLFGIILLSLWIFRSARPLLATLTMLGFGVAAGLSATLWWFETVHVMTLVFGSSLIGIAVDYAFHFFADGYRNPKQWTPTQALRHIRNPITLGMLSSVLAFTTLTIAPFPALQQLGVFAAAGLVGAWLTVMLLFANTAWRPQHRSHSRLLAWQQRVQKLAQHRHKFTVIAILTLLAIPAALQLTPLSSIRLLHHSPAELMAQELWVRQAIQAPTDSQFFIITAANSEQLLQREEHLLATLRQLPADQQPASYLATSQWLPSQQRQLSNREQVQSLYAPQQAVAQFAELLELPQPWLNQQQAVMQRLAAPTSTIDHWLQHPASAPWRHLWHCQPSAQYCAGVVNLGGIANVAALHKLAAAQEYVHFINPPAAITQLLQQHQQQAIQWLALAYLLVLGLLMLRYGIKTAVLTFASPALAGLFALAILGLLDQPFSIFNLFALVLVLGVGIDYAIFFRESAQKNSHAIMATLLAVCMSASTTLLAFGLLALSATPAIAGFGLTLFIGVSCAALLAALLQQPPAEPTQ